MSVAYSKSPVIKGTIRGDTKAHLRADLDAILARAGWTVKTAVTNGIKYTISSPDGFQCKVLIEDDTSYTGGIAIAGGGPSVVVQFLNFAETAFGFPHQLAIGPYPEFQVVAGICQLFIAVPGLADGSGLSPQSSVAGGIPARPANLGPCVVGIAPDAITDIWWSCGAAPSIFVRFEDFRIGPFCSSYFTHGLNGAATNYAGAALDASAGELCLFPLTPTLILTVPSPVITYGSHDPLTIDALMGWGWQIRGQLWDAFLRTAAGALDLLSTSTDTDSSGLPVTLQTISWHTDFYSTLHLILGHPVSPEVTTELGNYAY